MTVKRVWFASFVLIAIAASATAFAQGRAGAAGRGGAPPTARTAAPFDPTGYWVAIISEDWRWRMVTPAKGDVVSIPLSVDGLRVAEAWDPAKDEAAGEQCRAYGPPGLMRGPTRLRGGRPRGRASRRRGAAPSRGPRSCSRPGMRVHPIAQLHPRQSRQPQRHRRRGPTPRPRAPAGASPASAGRGARRAGTRARLRRRPRARSWAIGSHV